MKKAFAGVGILSLIAGSAFYLSQPATLLDAPVKPAYMLAPHCARYDKANVVDWVIVGDAAWAQKNIGGGTWVPVKNPYNPDDTTSAVYPGKGHVYDGKDFVAPVTALKPSGATTTEKKL